MLALLIFTVQVSCTSAIALLSSTLSWSLFVLVYYRLNQKLAKHQQTEAQLQDFYNNVPCGYHSIDENGNIIAMNDTELTWLGYSRDEVIGQLKITDLLTPESVKLFQEKFLHLLEKGWVKDMEIQMIRKNGTILPVLLNSTAIRDAAGHLVATRTTVFDITECKQAEAELKQSEEKFRQLAENIREVFWMTNADWSQILYVSPAYEQIWGRSCESLYRSLQSFLEAIHPEDRQRVIINLEQNATSTFDIEYRIVRPDNSVRWIKDRGFPIRNESGKVYRRAGIAQDITEHKQAEAMLRQVNEELEIRVQERTADLKQANERLQWELLERQRVEQALRESDERWQLAIRGSNDGIWDVNLKKECCFYSQQWREMLGYAEHEVPKNTEEWMRLVHPDDIERVMQTRQEHLDGKTPHYSSEYRIRCKDGSYKWILSRAQALWDERGMPLRLVGFQTDISSRQRTEASLRESKEQLQAILDNSPTVIYLCDPHNTLLLVNRQYESLFNLPRKQIIGKSIHEIWPQEVADRLVANNQTVIERGTPLTIEEVAPHDDGLHTYITSKFPLYDARGVPYAVCSISTDITERKQAEETLHKQACIFENLYDGVMLTDLEGHIIDWNPAAERIFGYTKTEVIGKTPAIIHKPEESPLLTHKIIKGMLKVGRWAGEINFARKDGTEGICETVVVPLYNEQGQAIATIGVNRDITERKQTEAALRQAYDELEGRVQERTRELAKANQELQMENAERKRVEAELKTRERQQAAVAQLGQQALAGKPLDCLMNQAVALVAQILEVESCQVLELLPNRQEFLLRAGVGWKAGLIGQAKIRVGMDSQAGYTLSSTEPVVVEDLRQETRFSSPSLLHDQSVVSGLSVIVPGQNRPYGVLEAHTSHRRNFTKDDVHFLQATANVLTTAIEHQQAEEALRRAHDELEIRVQARTTELAKANAELQQEIIERRQAEEERAKLIAILEATPDFISSASLDGQVFYFNKSARKILGLDRSEGQANFDIPNGHPDWANQLLQNEGIPAAIRDGTWVGETALLSHDGREIPLSQLIIAHKAPDGTVKMLSTIARDITQQKQIEATLLEAERRWRSLLEDVRLVVVGLDKQGNVEYVNPYFLELVGYTQAEVLGKDWFETFLPQHHKHRGQHNFLELIEQEFYIHDQSIILTKTGEERAIAWNNTLLRDSQGKVIGTLSIGEDITERQVIERMKDEFISVVSHELRTPLTSIHGALNLLSSGLVTSHTEKGRRVIDIAAESAERLVRLVNDILELERLESGKISLSKQTCYATQLMQEAIDMMQVMAHRAGITLSVAPSTIEFNADPDRIIQVLTNLLGNAIKFSASDSTVWLTAELETGKPGYQNLSSSNPKVVFAVKDRGRGIPADKLETIFERFHQVDASDSRKKGGTGLGLAICRSIVQQHGGRIWVESTLGEGSCFYFTLPCDSGG